MADTERKLLDSISQLPEELAFHVLSFLGGWDLLQVAKTSQHWRMLCEDDSLWHLKCREAGIEQLYELDDDLNEEFPCSPWKRTFKRQLQIEHNWQFKDKEPKVLDCQSRIRCLELCNEYIVTDSVDKTIKVWSANTGEHLRTLVGHSYTVSCMQMSNNILISGSDDGTLRVWNVETGECLHFLSGHTYGIFCLALDGTRVVSGSRDATLCLWNINSGECLQTLTGHTGGVWCVHYNGKQVVSASEDCLVKVWDPLTGGCIHTFHNQKKHLDYLTHVQICSLQFDGIHVVISYRDCSIWVWDVETGECRQKLGVCSLQQTLREHQSCTLRMHLRDNILITGTHDGLVKILDISTGLSLHSMSQHQGGFAQTLRAPPPEGLVNPNRHFGAINCLKPRGRFLITGSKDGKLKLWDRNISHFIRDLVTIKPELNLHPPLRRPPFVGPQNKWVGDITWEIHCSPTKLACVVSCRQESRVLLLNFDT